MKVLIVMYDFNILQTAKDLEEADKKRREEFKEYEMHKKFEQEEKMKSTSTVFFFQSIIKLKKSKLKNKLFFRYD